MTPFFACPDTQQLLHLLRDPLSAEEAEEFASHLEKCPACAGRLEALEKEDPLFGSLAPKGIPLPPPPPNLAQVMAQLERLPENLGGGKWATLENRQDTTPDQAAFPDGQAAPFALAGYDVLEELGQGGMGVVYKARHRLLNRLVALKTIAAERAGRPEERARLVSEARAVARLQHPHIIQIHEIGAQEDLLYLALEYASGGTLAEHLQGQPQLPRYAAEMVQVLAQAMHHAHQCGIIHRDLKPANILLQIADLRLQIESPSDQSAICNLQSAIPKAIPKVTDFGLAKQLDDQGQTQAGQIMGTPSYMAPEQAWSRSEAIGPATDVYALGAILYEMLTGRPPFVGANKWETLEQVRCNEPLPPSRLQPKLPPDLETIALKCLRKEPQQRYASALDLADDLGRFLAGAPILARPVGRLERLVKWGRRHPALAALAGVSVVALVSLLSAVGLYARYQAQQADISRQQLADLQHRDKVRADIGQQLARAQQHQAAQRWTEARTELTSARAALEAQADLQAEELRAEIDQRLLLVETRLHEQEEAQDERQQRQQFQKFRDDALFHQTLFTGLDVEGNRAKSQSAARAALALYGLDDPPQGPAATRPLALKCKHLSGPEQAELVRSCYELLLLWAQTEATAPPGPPKQAEQDRQRAVRALQLLNRAARLGQEYGVPSRLVDLRQASYLAQSKGEPPPALEIGWLTSAQDMQALDWFLLGLQSYRAGRFDLAGQACAEVLQQQPRHFWAQYLQAMCHLREGRWAQARADLTICLHARPDFAWPRVLRGFAASELGFKTGLIAELQAARVDFDRALALARADDALLRYTALVNRGVLHIRQQRFQEAVQDLQQATAAHPDGFQAYLNLSQAHLGLKQEKEALAVLDQAIAKVPRLGLLYESRAQRHRANKDLAKARADFEQALALEEKPSRLARLHLELAELLESDQQFSEALACCDRSLQQQPGFPPAQRRRAEILLALNRHDEAARALDEYLKVAGKPSAADFEARGLIHARARQLGAAVEMYTLALRLDPQKDRTRAARGWTYLLLDAPLLAQPDFQTCLNHDPHNVDALCGRSWAQARLKKTEAALADAEAAEKHGLLSDRLHYKLACIFALLAVQLETETGKREPLQPARRALCQEKALHHLQQALKQLPLDQQPAFWRNQVQNDPALAGIRHAPAYQSLAKAYGPPRR